MRRALVWLRQQPWAWRVRAASQVLRGRAVVYGCDLDPGRQPIISGDVSTYVTFYCCRVGGDWGRLVVSPRDQRRVSGWVEGNIIG